MNGFKNSTRMRSGFNFGSSAGFTTSTGKVQNIAYSRKTPRRKSAKFAEGGKIDSSLHSFKGDSQLNVEHGPSGGLRPGFTRGGYASKYADGGKVPPKKPPPPPTPTDTNRGTTTRDILQGRKKQMEDLGLKRGGVAHFAKGGRIPEHRVAAMEARKALAQHVATPAPRGHKGLGAKMKSC